MRKAMIFLQGLMLARCSFFCVGVDAHIDPLGTIEFALDFRKNGFYRRDDALNRPLRTSREITGGFLFASGEKFFRFVQPMCRAVVF